MEIKKKIACIHCTHTCFIHISNSFLLNRIFFYAFKYLSIWLYVFWIFFFRFIRSFLRFSGFRFRNWNRILFRVKNRWNILYQYIQIVSKLMRMNIWGKQMWWTGWWWWWKWKSSIDAATVAAATTIITKKKKWYGFDFDHSSSSKSSIGSFQKKKKKNFFHFHSLSEKKGWDIDSKILVVAAAAVVVVAIQFDDYDDDCPIVNICIFLSFNIAIGPIHFQIVCLSLSVCVWFKGGGGGNRVYWGENKIHLVFGGCFQTIRKGSNRLIYKIIWWWWWWCVIAVYVCVFVE